MVVHCRRGCRGQGVTWCAFLSFKQFNFADSLKRAHTHTRALSRQSVRSFLCFLPSVDTFEIDLPKKLVWIESDKDLEVLMEALKKSGKEVKYNGTKWRKVHQIRRESQWLFMLLDAACPDISLLKEPDKVKKKEGLDRD